MLRLTIKRMFLISLLVGVLSEVRATSLLINQHNPTSIYGYGLSFWDNMSAALDSAFEPGNITVSNALLDDLGLLMTFDRLWITARTFGDPGLSATEQANLAAFIATGRRVAVIGENNNWTAWNNSILAPVGGAYSGTDTSAPLTPVLGHPITAGITTLRTGGDGIALGGTPLFHINVVTLWGAQLNVLSLLSVNVIDDSIGNTANNLLFETNLARWLAAPEPSSVILFGSGAIAVFWAARRRRLAKCASILALAVALSH
ncbi:MAG: PEP-CTERM sorting domain-containing protein [Pirellulales bacterium]